MTLPDERYRALVDWPAQIRSILLQPGPLRKRDVRRVIAAALRHYPFAFEVKALAKARPDLLDADKDD